MSKVYRQSVIGDQMPCPPDLPTLLASRVGNVPKKTVLSLEIRILNDAPGFAQQLGNGVWQEWH
jgi:hypothetical protein